jgi:hypothetical protein
MCMFVDHWPFVLFLLVIVLSVLLLLIIVLSVLLSYFSWPLCCLCFFFWSLCCLSFCPFSLGHCVVCPSSFGHCVVCPFVLFLLAIVLSVLLLLVIVLSVPLSYFSWPLCCLSFDLQILITHLVSSNSSWDIIKGMLELFCSVLFFILLIPGWFYERKKPTKTL